MDIMNTIRRVGSAPGVRRIALHPRVRAIGAGVLGTRFLVAAKELETPFRFLAGEVHARGRMASYRTRTGMPVTLQHGRDAEALFELFVRGEYEPPAPIAQRLNGDRVRTILDVGANVGMFSAWAATRWPHASIVAFEPVESNARIYREWAQRSGARVELVAAAASTSSGELTFVDWGGGSHVALPHEKGERSPAVDLFDWLPSADLVKIDIEGGEWPILQDPRLADVSAVVVMEYHKLGSPSLPAKKAAEGLLSAAGFRTGFGSENHWGHGTLWAWKD